MSAIELAQSASRQLEALEKIGQSAGSGLQSGGPSGKPSEELIQAFQDALNAVASATPATSSSGPEAVSGPMVELLADPLLPGPAESMPPVSDAGNAAKATDIPSASSQQGTLDAHAAETAASPDRVNFQDVNAAEQPDFFMEFRAMPANGPTDSGVGSMERAGAEGEDLADLNGMEGVGETNETGGTSANASFDGQIGATGKASGTPDDTIKELGRLLEQVSQPGAAMTPTDVYRLQYLTGMLKIQAQTGLKASQSATQGLESVLRQSG